MKRRDALRFGLLGTLAACVSVDRTLLPGQAKDQDVRDHGAAGDGQQDDTKALQAAIDALPAEGGAVHVPDGRYLIDPERSVILRSKLHLDLAGGATLVGMPSTSRRSAILSGTSLQDVVITGGRLSGSGDGSTPAAGTVTAFGIDLRGCSQVRVERLHASGLGRDGIYVGAAQEDQWIPCVDVTLDACVLEHCRRQGVSVTSCTGFLMIGCEARNIGPDLPGSGIDLEPNPDRKVIGAEIHGCSFHDNTGFGIMVGGGGGEDLRIIDNEIWTCARGGILVKASQNAHVSGNQITGSEPAISVRGRTSGVRLERNVCTTGTIEVVWPATAEQIGNRC